jgi:cytochrome P450
MATLESAPGPNTRIGGAYWVLRWLGDPIAAYLTMRARFGDRFRIAAPTGWSLVLASPKAAEELLQTDHRAFVALGIGREAIGAVMGRHSLFLLGGEAHRRGRRQLSPALHGDRLRSLGPIIRETTLQAISTWKMGETFSMLQSMRQVSLDVMIHALLAPTDSAELEHVRTTVRGVAERARAAFLYLPWLQRRWIPNWRHFDDARSRRDRLFLQYVARAKDSGRSGVLFSLLEERRATDGDWPDSEIRDHLLTLLVAGHETTAISLACAMDVLARYPDVAERLRTELEGEDSVSRVDRGGTPLLDAVCNEVLRLYPPAMEATRTVGVDPVELGGYWLSPGTSVFVAIAAIHRDESLFPEPNEFRPDRFLERPFAGHEFLPFGFGNRYCLGAALAAYEFKVVLATVLAEVELGAAARPPKLKRYNLGAAPDTGVPIACVARRPARRSS